MKHAEATLTAPAKVNLYLDITGVREDGYHELDTLFWPLSEPADTLVISEFPGAEPGCVVRCDIPGLDGDDNLIVRAWRRFGRETGFCPSLAVDLAKRIPMGAGLGGGSTDCAAMLRYLNGRAGDLALGEDALCVLAAGLGADVPFFLLGKPAWAKGIGDRLEPAELDLAGLAMVVVCPNAHVSTPWAYGQWDRMFGPGGGSGRGMGKSPSVFLTSASGATMKSDSPDRLALFNAFEDVVFPAFPGLRTVKEKLLKSGACGAVMSGSGASVLGLFRNVGQAKAVAARFEDSGATTFLNVL